MFAAAFGAVAKDRHLDLSRKRASARGASGNVQVAGGSEAGSTTGSSASGVAEPRRPRPQQGQMNGPLDFPAGTGAGSSGDAAPPGLRGQRPGGRTRSGFDAPRTSSQHDDRFADEPRASPPPGFDGRQGIGGGRGTGGQYDGQYAGCDAAGSWRGGPRQPQQQPPTPPPHQQQRRRHPAEGLRPPMQDAMGNVIGISGRAPASGIQSAASGGMGGRPAGPMRDAMGNVLGVSTRAPASNAASSSHAPAASAGAGGMGRPLLPTAPVFTTSGASRPPQPLYQPQLPSHSMPLPPPPLQQQSQPQPFSQQQQMPPPGLARQHAALLPSIAADDDPAADGAQRQQPMSGVSRAAASLGGSPRSVINGGSSMDGRTASGRPSTGGRSMDASDALPPQHMNGGCSDGPPQERAASQAGAGDVLAPLATAASAIEDGMEPDAEAEVRLIILIPGNFEVPFRKLMYTPGIGHACLLAHSGIE